MLNQIHFCLPDTVFVTPNVVERIVETPQEAMPFENLMVICGAIAVIILIVGVAVYQCVKKTQDTKVVELDKKYEAEKEKREEERRAEEIKRMTDMAVRNLDAFFLKNSPSDEEKEMAQASLGYLEARYNDLAKNKK